MDATRADPRGERDQPRDLVEVVAERGEPERDARRIRADTSDYLPWDVVSETGSVLDALGPSLIAFTKTEVWPTLAAEAARRGIPLVLVAGTLPEGSSRLSPLARPILRPAFAKLAAVHAISEEDGNRFARLGVPPEHVVVTGDPGVDSAAQRAAAVDPEASHLRVFRNDRPRVVAGSTWPSSPASRGACANGWPRSPSDSGST